MLSGGCSVLWLRRSRARSAALVCACAERAQAKARRRRRSGRRRDAGFMDASLLEMAGLRRQAFPRKRVARMGYANGRFALMRCSSLLWTTADLASWRLRLEFLVAMRCRRVACERSTFPVPVILNRLATAFLVLLRAMGFGIRRGR